MYEIVNTYLTYKGFIASTFFGVVVLWSDLLKIELERSFEKLKWRVFLSMINLCGFSMFPDKSS